MSRDTPDNTGSFDTLFVVYEWACPNHIIALFYLSRRPYHRSHAQTRSVPRTGLPAKALALPFVISYKHHGKSVRVRESLRCCWMLPKMTIHPSSLPSHKSNYNQYFVASPRTIMPVLPSPQLACSPSNMQIFQYSAQQSRITQGCFA